MRYLLLLGAGFSRNWGGWLASEVFEFLLGCPELLANPLLRRALWKSLENGGFEQALSAIQQDRTLGESERERAAKDFEAALARMFSAMNAALMEVRTLEFPASQPRSVCGLLARFDAIFSLNQDLLLECRYMQQVRGASYSRGTWNGAQMPGLQSIQGLGGTGSDGWADQTWTDNGHTAVAPHLQPVFKLHGSTNWRTAAGGNVLVLGTSKIQAIQSNRLLRSYAEIFEDYLSNPAARLMVIGYGFGDTHINEILGRSADRGMQMFVIDPQGSDLARALNRTRQRGQIISKTSEEALFEQCLIGASRRPLREIFGAEVVEHRKLEQFFVTA